MRSVSVVLAVILGITSCSKRAKTSNRNRDGIKTTLVSIVFKENTLHPDVKKHLTRWELSITPDKVSSTGEKCKGEEAIERGEDWQSGSDVKIEDIKLPAGCVFVVKMDFGDDVAPESGGQEEWTVYYTNALNRAGDRFDTTGKETISLAITLEATEAAKELGLDKLNPDIKSDARSSVSVDVGFKSKFDLLGSYKSDCVVHPASTQPETAYRIRGVTFSQSTMTTRDELFGSDDCSPESSFYIEEAVVNYETAGLLQGGIEINLTDLVAKKLNITNLDEVNRRNALTTKPCGITWVHNNAHDLIAETNDQSCLGKSVAGITEYDSVFSDGTSIYFGDKNAADGSSLSNRPRTPDTNFYAAWLRL